MNSNHSDSQSRGICTIRILLIQCACTAGTAMSGSTYTNRTAISINSISSIWRIIRYMDSGLNRKRESPLVSLCCPDPCPGRYSTNSANTSSITSMRRKTKDCRLSIWGNLRYSTKDSGAEGGTRTSTPGKIPTTCTNYQRRYWLNRKSMSRKYKLISTLWTRSGRYCPISRPGSVEQNSSRLNLNCLLYAIDWCSSRKVLPKLARSWAWAILSLITGTHSPSSQKRQQKSTSS